MVFPADPVGPSGDGVLYVALGEAFLAMALHSARTVRQHSPTLGIAIVTNVADRVDSAFAWTAPLVDHWQHIPVEQGRNRAAKLRMYESSPFARTLYLDADTAALADIRPMFAWLDTHDVALHLQPKGPPQGLADVVTAQRLRLGDMPHWNGGVIGFRRSPAAQRFFGAWTEAFSRLGLPVDQAALAETVWSTDAWVLAFDARWNAPTSAARRLADSAVGGARILHYMHGMPPEILESCVEIAERVAADLKVSDIDAVRADLRQRTLNHREPVRSVLSPRSESAIRSALRTMRRGPRLQGVGKRHGKRD